MTAEDPPPPPPVAPGPPAAQAPGRAVRRSARRDRSADCEQTLVHDVCDRQAGALAEVYARHGDRLYAVARRLCGDQDAENVVQDVVLRFWQRPEAYDHERGSLRTYLTVATRGRAIDVLRSTVSRRDRERRAEEAIRRIPHETDPPASDAADGDTWRTLAQLPTSEREPIALAYLFGFTYREVASHLDLPEGTVKTRIRTGLRRIHTMLEDQRVAGTCPDGLSGS